MAWRHGQGGFAPEWAAPYGFVPPVPFRGPSREDELELLKEQAGQLAAALENIKKRMSQLEKEGG